jgi:hypothetical protein
MLVHKLFKSATHSLVLFFALKYYTILTDTANTETNIAEAQCSECWKEIYHFMNLQYSVVFSD